MPGSHYGKCCLCPSHLKKAADDSLAAVLACVSPATGGRKTEPVRWKMSVTADLGEEERRGGVEGRGEEGGGGGTAGLTSPPTPGWCHGPGQLVGREAIFLNEGAAPRAGP